MKRTINTIALFVVAIALAACGAQPAGNVATNTTNNNANAGKPAAAEPTSDALLALDKQANEAYFKGDSKFFEGFLSDKFSRPGHAGSRAAELKGIAGTKCDMKSFSLDEPKMLKVDNDTYVLSYKGTFDGTCNDGPGGKVEKSPSPVRAATVFVRNGDKWQAAFHTENAITSNMNPTAPVAEAPKKEVSTAEANKTANTNSNSNSPAATDAPTMTKSANTDALVKAELAGWEAWKNKDTKGLDALTAKNAALLNASGSWLDDRAGIIKYWAEMPCEGVTKVDVKDGVGIQLSPTAEMLIFNGWSDGTCYGSKNGTQNMMSVYVKEGDAWKMAFGYSGPTL
ncbi:MAG: nuclear transport factor 2 family protein [Acidobacteriota bacterium]